MDVEKLKEHAISESIDMTNMYDSRKLTALQAY
jgi:hypothetical protein